MRVLFTSFAYVPETSGVPIVVKYLAEGLASHGHTVTVATRTNGKKLPYQEMINGVDVHRFNIYQSLLKKDLGDTERYISFVIGAPKDVLVLECVQCQTTDILLPYLSSMNCRIVLHSHGGPGIHQKFFQWNTNVFHTIGNTFNWFRWKKYYGRTLPMYSDMIDLVICLSLCASDLEYMNSHMKRVAIVENASEEMFFQFKGKSEQIDLPIGINAKDYILCIANYVPNKDQVEIVRAFEKIRESDCALVLIGSKKNKYYDYVLKEANRVSSKSKKKIYALAGINRTLLPKVLGNARLFVMASHHEEYPVSLVEAMSMGVPFLSTDVGCARILPGGVTVSNRGDLALYMDYLISHPEMLSRLGNQGFKYAESNNRLDKVISLFENYLIQDS